MLDIICMLCLALSGTLHINKYRCTFRNRYTCTNYLTSLFSHLKNRIKSQCIYTCVCACNCRLKRAKDLTLKKVHLKNANSTGTKDMTRLLNKLMTLKAPLELPREETASTFFGLIRPCLDQWSQLQITGAITKLTSRMVGNLETLSYKEKWR